MQMYFVQPFDFTQDGQSASYNMERLLIPDMAIQWVHGALSPRDLSKFLERIFHFINLRPKITTQKASGVAEADRLYRTKVVERIEKLRGMPQFGALEQLTAQSVGGLDQVLNRYLSLYDRRRDQIDGRHLSIGHGDLCFSNILYSKSTQLMRFIDPRGAMTRDQLYTDPYYDIAKLSHSVVGGYDFINSGQFELVFDTDLSLRLTSEISQRSWAASIFHEQLAQSGFDPQLVRLYEASLFISMLPLHIDNPKKVLGFILTAAQILMTRNMQTLSHIPKCVLASKSMQPKDSILFFTHHEI
jgi:hypothetical protein